MIFFYLLFSPTNRSKKKVQTVREGESHKLHYCSKFVSKKKKEGHEAISSGRTVFRSLSGSVKKVEPRLF